MILKGIIDESFGDYKLCSMLLITNSCEWKCEGCQNVHLSTLPSIEYQDDEIFCRFLTNPLSEAIVFGGLEPLDQADEIVKFIRKAKDEYHLGIPLIFYTGYTEEELSSFKFNSFRDICKEYRGRVIIKCGRYIQNCPPKYDENLGVTLISNNQFSIVL